MLERAAAALRCLLIALDAADFRLFDIFEARFSAAAT